MRNFTGQIIQFLQQMNFKKNKEKREKGRDKERQRHLKTQAKLNYSVQKYKLR